MTVVIVKLSRYMLIVILYYIIDLILQYILVQINILTSEEQADLSWPMRISRSQQLQHILKVWVRTEFMIHTISERNESRQTDVSWLCLTRGCRFSIHAFWVQLIVTQELLDALERHASLCAGVRTGEENKVTFHNRACDESPWKCFQILNTEMFHLGRCETLSFTITNYVQCNPNKCFSHKHKSSGCYKYN